MPVISSGRDLSLISGVPQGTVLGLLLFLAYINDLPEVVRSSDARLFADDCLLYKHIKNERDAALLQEDLSALEEWEQKWQMKFHPEKCTVLHISTNRRNVRNSSYTLHDHVLEEVESGKYLGVTLTSDLSWRTHVEATAAKASKTLGFLRVRDATYTGMVRPTLDYASSSWDPYLAEDINKLEQVQRRAARFVHNNYHDRQPGCVSKMVQDLNWEPPSNRRRANRLTMLYKIQRGLVDMDATDVIRPNDKRTRGTNRL